jgi:NADH-quinone oxidoreductase subunit M
MSRFDWMPSLVTFLPLLGVLVLIFLPREKVRWHRICGILSTLPPLLLSLVDVCAI